MKVVKQSKQSQALAIRTIKAGGVVVFPTDTVYGLICDAFNKKAVEKIFKIKKRPKGKSISIFVNDLKSAKEFAKINLKYEKFLKKSWPGAITAVLKPKRKLPPNISQGKGTIGVRVPNYKLIDGLILKNKAPLAETSANISGQPATTKINEVLNYFIDAKFRPDLIIDAGNLPERGPSKVVDLTGDKIKILRP